MTTTERIKLTVSYNNRRRAYDAVVGLRDYEDDNSIDLRVRVIVTDEPRYIIECESTYLAVDRVRGILQLASEIEAHNLTLNDEIVIEFYQGHGLSKFNFKGN